VTTPRKRTTTPTRGLTPKKVLVPKKAGIHTVVEKITPEMALEVLTNRNAVNRPLNRHHVEAISDAILANEWRNNGQTISFNTDDDLQDGQHRLSAIARSGVTVEALVAYNVDPESRPTVDVGRKRTVADELTMRGETGSTTIAAILMMKKRLEMPGSGRSVVLTTPAALRMLEELPDIREVAEQAQMMRGYIAMPSSAIGYCMLAFRELSKDDDKSFWEVFSTGQFDGSGDPRFVLHRTLGKLQKNPHFSAGQFTSKTQQAALTIKAWNAYREVREVQILRYTPSKEKFPKAV
jgi:hypothetical protein